MSKISDYIELVRRSHQQSKDETVAEFAASLHRPVDSVIEQLKGAGVSVSGPEDPMTAEAKKALLTSLRTAHATPKAGRKRIQIETRAERLLSAVRNNGNGAELEVLNDVASAVIWDEPIDPLLQQLANIVIAKAVINGSLPPGRRGRPTSEGAHEFGVAVAWEFWNMRDSGVPYKEAIQALSDRHHKDERHLSRIIENNTSYSEKTREDRDRLRTLFKFLAENRAANGPSQYEKFMFAFLDQPEAPEFSGQDYLDHLNEQLKKGSI